MRELAGYDHDRARIVFRWPLREALLAYLQRLRETAREDYQHQLSQWAALAPHSSRKLKPPPLPLILKDID